jgi:hypothetical protein
MRFILAFKPEVQKGKIAREALDAASVPAASGGPNAAAKKGADSNSTALPK